MTTYTLKETTTGADGLPVVVTRTYEWDDATADTLNAASIAAFMRIPDAQFDEIAARNFAAFARANIDAAVAHQMAAYDKAADAVLSGKAPRYLLPGDGQRAFDATDAILTVGADGAVYRDGVRLGGAFVSALCCYGATIVGKGKTDGQTYRWDGTRWLVVSVDPTVITF